jgi:hypothetical protein
MMSKEKQQPVQTHSINQCSKLTGHSFMFPLGVLVHVSRRVDDMEKKKSVYQGHVFNELTKTGYDVQFNAKTLDHVNHKEGEHFGPYNVKLDLSSIDLSGLPAIPF